MTQSELNNILLNEQKRRIKEITELVNRLNKLFDKSFKDVAELLQYARLVNGRTLDLSTKKKIEKLTKQLYTKINEEILAGINTAKSKSAETAFKIESKVKKKTKATYTKNEKVKFNFSKRIWKHNNYYKKQITDVLTAGVKNGTSAKELARQMQGFVHSKASGKGIYKDPRKNAERLARNEINNYYRKADAERWKGQWFVKGIEVKLSLQHPVFDICNHLKGRYPKDFTFVGWHPNCLCHAVPILATEKEMERYEDYELGLRDKPPNIKQITTTPPKSRKWYEKNRERVAGWKSTPYWLTENKKYYDDN